MDLIFDQLRTSFGGLVPLFRLRSPFVHPMLKGYEKLVNKSHFETLEVGNPLPQCVITRVRSNQILCVQLHYGLLFSFIFHQSYRSLLRSL